LTAALGNYLIGDIDTAVGYRTESEIGQAIRTSGVPREEIAVTTKIRKQDHGYDPTRRSVHESLRRLGVGQVDLYLIHWPNPRLDRYVETWRALIAARDDGEVRSIGVSNFNPCHLDRLIEDTGVVPAINQIELHPHFPQPDARAFHRHRGIQTQSWSPLGLGRHQLLDATPVTDAADRHHVTPAQVVLRWHQQLGTIPIPRSSNPGRQRENLDLDAVHLDDDELKAITALGNHGGRLWGGDPETEER
jgi:2,5-diketo-D-gluconate reductase A